MSSLALSPAGGYALRYAHASPYIIERNANIFLWSAINGSDLDDGAGSKYQLIACFSSEIVGEVTVSSLLRWMNSLLPVVTGGKQADSEIMIKRVSLEHLRPFIYKPIPLDDNILCHDALSPGDYGCFFQDWRKVFQREYTFTTRYPLMRQLLDQGEDKEDKEVLQRLIMKSPNMFQGGRDRCIITGIELNPNNIMRNWILPPCRLDWAPIPGKLKQLGEGIDSLECTKNVMTMRSDIYELWLSHSLAVDVDDNFRIRAFTKDACGFPARVLHTSDICEESLEFFREHFRIALAFNVAGGDIRKRFGEASLLKQNAFMAAMCVDPDHPPDEENYNKNQHKWESPMGWEMLTTVWPLDKLPDVATTNILNVK